MVEGEFVYIMKPMVVPSYVRCMLLVTLSYKYITESMDASKHSVNVSVEVALFHHFCGHV